MRAVNKGESRLWLCSNTPERAGEVAVATFVAADMIDVARVVQVGQLLLVNSN